MVRTNYVWKTNVLRVIKSRFSHDAAHLIHFLPGFNLRVKPDKHSTANFFGFLEVQREGVWGSVCARGFDDKVATVACRQLGFAGGAAYNPPKNISSPILLDNLNCVGSEESLLRCAFTNWNVQTGCDYYSDRAGVLCYNDTGECVSTEETYIYIVL